MAGKILYSSSQGLRRLPTPLENTPLFSKSAYDTEEADREVAKINGSVSSKMSCPATSHAGEARSISVLSEEEAQKHLHLVEATVRTTERSLNKQVRSDISSLIDSQFRGNTFPSSEIDRIDRFSREQRTNKHLTQQSSELRKLLALQTLVENIGAGISELEVELADIQKQLDIVRAKTQLLGLC